MRLGDWEETQQEAEEWLTGAEERQRAFAEKTAAPFLGFSITEFFFTVGVLYAGWQLFKAAWKE